MVEASFAFEVENPFPLLGKWTGQSLLTNTESTHTFLSFARLGKGKETSKSLMLIYFVISQNGGRFFPFHHHCKVSSPEHSEVQGCDTPEAIGED